MNKQFTSYTDYTPNIEDDSKIIEFEHLELGNLRTIILDKGKIRFLVEDIIDILDCQNINIMKNISQTHQKTVAIRLSSAIYQNAYAQLNSSNDIRIINLLFIDETGIEQLIRNVKSKDSKKFGEWISGYVISTIKKFGVYIGTNAPIIREAYKEVHFNFDRAMKLLTKIKDYELNSIDKNTDEARNKVHAILTSVVNDLAGVSKGERDNATDEQLLNLIKIESSYTASILYGITENKSLRHIINSCGDYVRKHLGIIKIVK